MAARKKKSKKKASRGRKAAKLNLVVGSKVKEAVKATGYRCSGDFVDGLNAKVNAMIAEAASRCGDNKRGTVRPYDL